jgi:hypothetical protein
MFNQSDLCSKEQNSQNDGASPSFCLRASSNTFKVIENIILDKGELTLSDVPFQDDYTNKISTVKSTTNTLTIFIYGSELGMININDRRFLIIKHD